MKISIVPPGLMHQIIGELAPFAAKGSEWTLGRLKADDILASMFNPQIMTWVLFEDDSPIVGYLCTQIIDYPHARHFAVLNCGGMDGMLDQCVDLVFDTFEQYARQSGCDGIEIIGRPAWWKHIKGRGFAQPQYQYFKKFDKED